MRGLTIKLFKRIQVTSEKCEKDTNYLKRYEQRKIGKEVERLKIWG